MKPIWGGVFDFILRKSSGAFDESEHPRHPKGSKQGGKFAPKGGGGGTRDGGDGVLRKLMGLRGKFAQEAQEIYDGWDASDEELGDGEFGFGGICDAITRAMGDVIAGSGLDVETTEAGQDGGDHSWLLAIDHKNKRAFEIDIPPSIYERGGGYSWKKVDGVKFSADNVYVGEISYSDVADTSGEEGD